MANFEKLFKKNYSFIYKYLLKLSCNASLAEELTQETFFRAYMNLAQLKDENKVPVWLCQIAKNAYFAWYNEQKKLTDTDALFNIASKENIEDEFLTKELSSKAAEALNTLEEPYKEVFILHTFGGLSLYDISGIFKKSESWARVTFYRAKQKLKEGIM